MTLQIEIPEELVTLLGPDPTTAVREAVLLQLVREGKMTVARASQALGLDREESIRWYTGHGYTYPALTPADLQQDLDTVKALGG